MSGARTRRFEGYLFVGPFLLLYLFLLVYPLLMGIGLSLNRADCLLYTSVIVVLLSVVCLLYTSVIVVLLSVDQIGRAHV